MINIAHYSDVQKPEDWACLLEHRNAPTPHMLKGGTLKGLEQTKAMRGLHLIRGGPTSNAYSQNEAPVPVYNDFLDDDIEQNVKPAKLNLRRNRPLVTLGYINRGYAEFTIRFAKPMFLYFFSV